MIVFNVILSIIFFEKINAKLSYNTRFKNIIKTKSKKNIHLLFIMNSIGSLSFYYTRLFNTFLYFYYFRIYFEHILTKKIVKLSA